MRTQVPRMRLVRLVRVVFALALAGLGIVGLVSGDFTYFFQPVPAWVPGRTGLALASGMLLCGAAAGLLWQRTRARAALLSAGYGLASILLVHLPQIAAKPSTEVHWFGLSEVAIVVVGAWLLFSREALPAASPWRRALASARGVRIARLVFALALLPVGLSHFVYSQFTASLVPAWLPGHLGWAYATGAAHLATSLAVLFRIVPALAASLEALMVSFFVVTIHLPDLMRAPRSREAWAELLIASAMGSAIALVAGSFGPSQVTGRGEGRPP